MSRPCIATVMFLVSLPGSALAEDDYWFCNTNPGQGDKTVYVSDLFGPFAPDPDRLTAQQDVRADFMKFIQENHPDALANHKGGEQRVIGCGGSTDEAVLRRDAEQLKRGMAGPYTVVETHWSDAEGRAGKGAHLPKVVPRSDR